MRNLWHLFLSNHIFSSGLGHPRGQWWAKRSKIAHPSKNDTQKLEIHRFYTVTHLGQVISFDPFWGTLGVKKGQKLGISLRVTPQKLRICTEK